MSDSGQVRSWLTDAARVIASVDADAVAGAVRALIEVRGAGGTIFVAGNGGSASTASHLALDLQKAARVDGAMTRAVALSDNVGLITAWANDESFDRVFAAQLEVLARPGDGLVVFSVSGSSPNVVAAIEAARERGVRAVAFVGAPRGRAAELADQVVVVPSEDYGWVESAHVVLGHVLVYALRREGRSAAAATVEPEVMSGR